MPRRSLNLKFPTAGVSRRFAYQSEPPFTAHSASNVRPDDTIAERERGGSRPGLAKVFSTQMGAAGGSPVYMASDVNYVASSVLTTQRVFAANGVLYYGVLGGALTSAGAAVSATKRVVAQDFQQKLYLADWDPDAAISAAARAPKVWNPATATLTNWSAAITAGTLPTGCPVFAVYRGRALLASPASDPIQAFASRLGDFNDWDYAATDDAAAFSFALEDKGKLLEPITAIMPHSNNCCLIGGHNSLTIMRGDLGYGGELELLSGEHGVVSRFGWCHAPASIDKASPRLCVFLSQDGVMAVPASCESELAPQSMSREKLPQELRGINPDTYDVSLAYDTFHRGIHICISPIVVGVGTAQHWWLDWETRGFFQVDVNSDHDPGIVYPMRRYFDGESAVVWGTRKGYAMNFRKSQTTDDGTNFDSHIEYGPFFAGQPGIDEGIIAELSGTLAEGSRDVRWKLRAGTNAEEAHDATPSAEGKWTEPGSNNTDHPRVRGTDFFLRLENGEEGKAWGIERVVMDIVSQGRARG